MKIQAFLLLAILVAVQAADINAVRKEALKKVEGFVTDIKKLAETTSGEVEKRSGNNQVIIKHQREFGEGVFRKIHFEVTKMAKSAYMMANLIAAPNEVFRCIEYREREGVEESEKLYNKNFLDAGRDYEVKAENYQRDLIKVWKDDYYKSIDEYGKIYQNTVSDIQRAKTESAISSSLKQFEQTTNKMADIVKSVLPAMNRLHIQVLDTFIELVAHLQEYAKYRVDETTKAIRKCFSTQVSSGIPLF